jgi:lipoprotein-releasing system ATP-binding protein
MLTAKNITKSFGKLQVLKGIDLEIPKGQFTAIVGKSGSGKTTLLQILGTLDQADSGEVVIDNQNILSLSQKAQANFRNQKLGFIYQFHHLLNEFTAIENVMIPALIRKESKKDARIKALELLDYLGLKDRIDHKPTQMSGGEQQRVAVARALINQPLILFADEPTGNLDSQTSEDMQNLFLKMKSDFDQTIVVVTHNETFASMCDKQYIMKDGLIQ